jgi:hypothetical protein
MSFKGNFSLEKRREIYQKESYMHPHRVAIVVEMHPKSKLQVERFFKYAQVDSGSWLMPHILSDPFRKPSKKNSSKRVNWPIQTLLPYTFSAERNY